MQILLNGIIVGSAYALMGMGFSLIYSTVRHFDLSYGIVAMIGAYMAYTMMNVFSWSYFPALLLGAVVSMLLGIMNYAGLYRVMVRRKSSPLVIMVASFGMLTIYQNTAALLWGNATKAISLSDKILKGYEFWGMIITPTQLTILAVAVALVIVLELFLQKTRYGMAIRAIGDNQELTKVLGLRVNRIVILVVMIGTFLSSVSGTLIALEIGIRPLHGVYLMIKAFIAAVIGGLGSIRGALIGGFILGIVENVGIYFIGAQWQNTVAFTVLVFFLLFLPEGLFAKRRLLKMT